MSSRPPSRVVFVGNIPYGLSEEQITDIFSSAGKVERFRLVYDSETGRPKGFGFADYPDTDSASSAVRNLNDYEIMGRKLRVDFSNEQKSGGDDDAGNNQPSSAMNLHAANGGGTFSQPSTLPQLPAGKEIPAGLTCTDAISRTLNTLPPPQLLDILGQMKSLASSDPQRATELLQQAPQLSYAVFQALLLMGLVSPEAIQSVAEPGAPQAHPPATGFPGAIPGYPAANNTPPVPAAQDPDALIRQVMELPQAQIDMLPEAEKQQILALRATFAAQQRR
ncbi:hinge domain of cleavage stimulation factor subunit 2 domain-containing protein [Hirsutella rhossiliensis]|uniref:Hinge domain of cleavage stimulation factor subunit 2 domain-containing protein n=1 Tax=Hirsutella rhossiliensis TaxID=111463 RepID=A0A9P8SHN2_9HYPO|nr:hinge domain of cleavage stimulation factor subunit 2 domain-containing protein [Hirsutella rhossiliensis]KAH0963303.1 hinge domain of cleavage stimulation factor subunit 2 domain-containing protein [Hirsutella rhossiliensis]